MMIELHRPHLIRHKRRHHHLLPSHSGSEKRNERWKISFRYQQKHRHPFPISFINFNRRTWYFFGWGKTKLDGRYVSGLFLFTLALSPRGRLALLLWPPTAISHCGRQTQVCRLMFYLYTHLSWWYIHTHSGWDRVSLFDLSNIWWETKLDIGHLPRRHKKIQISVEISRKTKQKKNGTSFRFVW